MRVFLILISLFLLSACGPELLFGGVVGTGATLAKKKTVGDSISDVTIWNKINALFVESNKKIKGIVTDISVEVSEGRVLLTGTTNSVQDRLEILKLVWKVNGVKEVLNEIKVTDGSKYGFSSFSKDAWITTKVKTKFLSHKEIRSLNYNVETIEATVYIIGISGSEHELSLVVSEAEAVEGVKKVINYVRVVTEHEVSQEEAKLNEERNSERNEKMSNEEPKTKQVTKKTSKKVIEEDKSDFDHENRHEIEIGEDD